jgi:hypothetical protein
MAWKDLNLKTVKKCFTQKLWKKVISFIDMLAKEYITPEGVNSHKNLATKCEVSKMDSYRVVMSNFNMEKYNGPDLYVAMKIAENIGYETTLYKNDIPIKWHSVISGWNKV